MKMMHGFRVGAGMAGLLSACLALSGCVGSPTYGTGATAGEQLLTDLTDAASLTGGNDKKKNLKYTPRPGLVLPAAGQKEALAEPQKSLAGKENPQWLESPEETRARLSAEAEENKNNPNFRSPLARASANGRELSSAEQLAAYRAARAEQKGAYEDRRFLSDPPGKYRSADPAALQDLGEPETKKEKRRKEQAKTNTGSKWWMPFQ